MPTTMDEVLDFIGQLPDAIKVAKVQEASARRLQAIDKEAFAGILPGRRARITDSTNPAMLRGLTGTVQERNRSGSRAGFLLDEESTRILRRDPRNTKFRIPEDMTRFRLPGSGIPIACLAVIEDD
ncbi:hypothetical protein ACM01_15340 [Streptomyces viridochromogenes]|uniref:Uncharacterized protein n=1 Tax=Streptomyces viridochromogenes TaxID=1938 RepID=A0A0J8C8Q1_STRVR|nr:hypothetical protein [Streptomyces viridochromogenes]KMS74270.1 hypothetical protein ACM01_15340 [Streptomyces viridochromogenes]